jgi:hypothetical protein
MAALNDIRESQPLGLFPIAMTVLVGALRLLPHLLRIPSPFNVAPVTAISLYGGARLRFWQALTLPLAVMFATDLFIWWLKPDWPPFDPWVYGSFAASVLLGRLLANTNSPWRIGGCIVLASAQFFLVTNFGAWVNPEHGYAHTLEGLASAYYMALKFSPDLGMPYGFALPLFVSDCVFGGLLFGLHALAARRAGRGVPAVQLRGVS